MLRTEEEGRFVNINCELYPPVLCSASSLDLRGCKLQPEEAIVLSSILPQNPSLTLLDLRDNHMEQDWAALLDVCMLKLTSLTR